MAFEQHRAVSGEAHAWLEGALGWWTDAGLDYGFHDKPTDWLAPAHENDARSVGDATPAPVAQPEPARRPVDARERLASAEPSVAITSDPAHLPQSLEQFATWWLTEPTLSPSPAAQRVPPSGPANAQLMVLVPTPEAGDTVTLLSGREGRLLDALLAAIGLSRDAVYVASALPAAMPMPDWQGLAASGLGAVVMHHIALANPQRLLVLGKTDISSLITHDPANNAAILPSLNHKRASVPGALDFALATLLAQPSLKRRVWLNWLEWTEAGLQ